MTTSAATLQVQVLRQLDELDALDGAWRSLLAVTPSVSGFQSAPWVTAYWEALPHKGQSLFITVIEDHGRVVAIFPTQVSETGRLSFIGVQVSNYSGPLFEPEQLPEIVAAWARFIERTPEISSIDLSGLRETSPFFRFLHESSLPGWGEPLSVHTNVCPYVDLRAGWEALYGRHKSKQRANWKRKWARLAQLGELEFIETASRDDILREMPHLFSLYEARWAGHRNASAAFSFRHQAFQTAALGTDSEADHVQLSMLRLDKEVIAYAYGIRSQSITSSYVLAHNDLLKSYSPGLLLLLRILEAACRRGDPAYDFSLGETSYKELWATGQSSVYRMLWGRGRWPRFLWQRAWVAGRSVEWLRTLKLRGPRVMLRGREEEELAPDEPGLPAGQPGFWFSHRVLEPPTTRKLEFDNWSYEEMNRCLSPRLLELALDRNFRGDELVAVRDGDRLIGVAWRACTARRALIASDEAITKSKEVIWYHPVAAEGIHLETLVLALGKEASCIVVSGRALESGDRIQQLGRFPADLAFKRREETVEPG